MTSEYPEPIKAQIEAIERMKEMVTKSTPTLVDDLLPPGMDTASALATARMKQTGAAALSTMTAGMEAMQAYLVALAENADQEPGSGRESPEEVLARWDAATESEDPDTLSPLSPRPDSHELAEALREVIARQPGAQ